MNDISKFKVNKSQDSLEIFEEIKEFIDKYSQQPELSDCLEIFSKITEIPKNVLELKFKKLIYSSGGFSENADRLRSYVVYPNGLKKQTRNFVLFKSYPKVIPGSVIVVPERIERESKVLNQLTQITTITSSIASLLAIVKF